MHVYPSLCALPPHAEACEMGISAAGPGAFDFPNSSDLQNLLLFVSLLVLFFAGVGECGFTSSTLLLCLWSALWGSCCSSSAEMPQPCSAASEHHVPLAAYPLAGILGARLRCAPVRASGNALSCS